MPLRAIWLLCLVPLSATMHTVPSYSQDDQCSKFVERVCDEWGVCVSDNHRQHCKITDVSNSSQFVPFALICPTGGTGFLELKLINKRGVEKVFYIEYKQKKPVLAALLTKDKYETEYTELLLSHFSDITESAKGQEVIRQANFLSERACWNGKRAQEEFLARFESVRG